MPPRTHMKRFENQGQSRFLTFSCYQRLPLLGHPAIRDLFVEHLAKARHELSFKLYGWVIMPEHVHLLLVPPLPEVSVADILARIKRPLARGVIARWRKLKAPILSKITDAEGLTRYWQKGGGHDRNVRRKGEITSKLNYMHRNPVTRGLVEKPTDRLWSSARSYTKGVVGMIEVDPIPW